MSCLACSTFCSYVAGWRHILEPALVRVRLTHVHRDELDVASLVLLSELLHGRQLPPERWSGDGTRDQHEVLLTTKCSRVDPLTLGRVELDPGELRPGW